MISDWNIPFALRDYLIRRPVFFPIFSLETERRTICDESDDRKGEKNNDIEEWKHIQR